jgi:hypothetical protein
MPWHQITLPIARVAAGDLLRLMNEMEAVLMAAGMPEDAAVYGDLNANPKADVFFNPKASEIAADLIGRWGGGPCPDPGEPVALLIGHQEAYYAQNKSQRPKA